MNIMMIGFGMILISAAVLMFISAGILFRWMFEATIEVYRGRNVIEFLIMPILWAFVIGTVLIVIGNVMALFGGV